MITIAIDIDGVIYDVIGHIVDKFKPHLGRLRPCSWDCWSELETSKKEFFEMYTACWREFNNKYTDPYSYELFRWLKNQDDIRISILTKRAKHNIIDTIKYLEDNDFHYDSFTVITDSYDKTHENFDIIIEDNPKNIPENKLGILVTQEWNKAELGNFIRVDCLKEIPYLLEKILPFWSHQRSLQSH